MFDFYISSGTAWIAKSLGLIEAIPHAERSLGRWISVRVVLWNLEVSVAMRIGSYRLIKCVFGINDNAGVVKGGIVGILVYSVTLIAIYFVATEELPYPTRE